MINGRKIIALCINRVHDDESNKVVTALNRQVTRMGHRLFVYGVCSDLFWDRPDEKGEASVFDLINYDVIDAMVIYEEKIKNKEIINNIVKKSLEHKIPVIEVGHREEKGCINVAFAYEEGFEMVVRHVIEEHGIRDVHFMGGQENNEFSDVRKNVFIKVLEENKIPFDESMVSYGQFWDRPTRAAMEKLIAENRIPKAVICANDSMAISVCDVLKNHGYMVPEDVIVTGFDGIDEIYFSLPKITSSFCCYEDLAAKITEILLLKFAGKEVERAYEVVPRLVISESCGCEKRSQIPVSKFLNDINGRFYNVREGSRSLTAMSSRVQTCDTVEQLSAGIQNYLLTNMCCLIKKECMDESINPMTIVEEGTFGDTMCLILDTDNDKLPIPRDFETKEIIPGLHEYIEREMPLIFAALYFNEVPLGYVCFHYPCEDIDNFDKIALIVNGLNNAIGGFRNMRHQQFLAKHIESMYQLDALTGLYNRIFFMKKYEEMAQRIKAKSGELTFVLADLDGLKYINDHFGHGEGDNAIRTVAKALQKACPDGVLCARFGGDEMMAVCEGNLGETMIRDAFEAYLKEYNANSEKLYQVASSLGIYTADYTEVDEFEELLKKADQRMYQDKAMRKKQNEIS